MPLALASGGASGIGACRARRKDVAQPVDLASALVAARQVLLDPRELVTLQGPVDVPRKERVHDGVLGPLKR
jgi:hypothetical protein